MSRRNSIRIAKVIFYPMAAVLQFTLGIRPELAILVAALLIVIAITNLISLIEGEK